jgi:hypothetical protein
MTPSTRSADPSPTPGTEPRPAMRTLQIEADGDPWRGLIKPKIRLTGRWLEHAGFKPGERVQVTCLAPGLLELRAPEPLTLREDALTEADLPEIPF